MTSKTFLGTVALLVSGRIISGRQKPSFPLRPGEEQRNTSAMSFEQLHVWPSGTYQRLGFLLLWGELLSAGIFWGT